jgi:hypothetical protein
MRVNKTRSLVDKNMCADAIPRWYAPQDCGTGFHSLIAIPGHEPAVPCELGILEFVLRLLELGT